jgi:hypothetical protein
MNNKSNKMKQKGGIFGYNIKEKIFGKKDNNNPGPFTSAVPGTSPNPNTNPNPNPDMIQEKIPQQNDPTEDEEKKRMDEENKKIEEENKCIEKCKTPKKKWFGLFGGKKHHSKKNKNSKKKTLKKSHKNKSKKAKK